MRLRQADERRRIMFNGLFVAVGLVAVLLGHSFPVTLIWYAWAAWMLAHARLKPGLRLLMAMLLCGAFCSLLTTESSGRIRNVWDTVTKSLIVSRSQKWRNRSGDR